MTTLGSCQSLIQVGVCFNTASLFIAIESRIKFSEFVSFYYESIMVDFDLINKYIKNFTRENFLIFMYDVRLSDSKIGYLPWAVRAADIISSSRRSIIVSGYSFIISLIILIVSSIYPNTEISSFYIILYTILFIICGPLTSMECIYLLHDKDKIYSMLHHIIKNGKFIFFHNTLAVFEEWESQREDLHIPLLLNLIEWVFIFPLFIISGHNISILIRDELRSIFGIDLKNRRYLYGMDVYRHDTEKWDNLHKEYKSKYEEGDSDNKQ